MNRNDAFVEKPRGFIYLDLEDLRRLAIYWDGRYPIKVRKVRLLQALDLPLNESFVFPADTLVNDAAVGSILEGAQPFFKVGRRVVVRTAWTPDFLNAPWFTANSPARLRDTLQSLREPGFRNAVPGHDLTHLILHADTAHPSDPSERRNYLAGRLLIHPDRDIPVQKTIEIVQGEYFAKILDVGGFDLADERFARYRIEVGQRSWRPLKVSPRISVDEIRMLLNNFKRIEVGAEKLREVLSFVHHKQPGALALIIEFQATKGSDKVFHTYDFDYAIQKSRN